MGTEEKEGEGKSERRGRGGTKGGKGKGQPPIFWLITAPGRTPYSGAPVLLSALSQRSLSPVTALFLA